MRLSRCVFGGVLLGASLLSGCRTAQVASLGSTWVRVPADWHDDDAQNSSRATALRLKRAGIPFLEKDSVAGFYVSSNPTTNTLEGAQIWQDRMMQPLASPKAVPGSTQRMLPKFIPGHKEQITGKYATLCVTTSRADATEVLNCAVVSAPVMFSFAGSKAGADEAREMLRSLR